MSRLIKHWRERFDWRAQERRLNALPQFMADVDGSSVQFLQHRAVALAGLTPLPLIITHGFAAASVSRRRACDAAAGPGGIPAGDLYAAALVGGAGVRRAALDGDAAGWHFAALEQPELLAEDIRAFYRPLRARSGG